MNDAPRLLPTLAAGLLMTACASYGPPALPVGSSVDDVTRAMGPPTGRFLMRDGQQRLEFARGPFGKHTYMVDFDAQGRLARWEQVLTEQKFNEIQSGMDASEVRAAIGRASETFYIGWQKQTVWAYRYDAVFCQWFQVGLDGQGKVTDTAYGPDPICEPRDIPDITPP